MDTRGHNFQQEFTFPSSPRPRTPDEWRLALQSVKLLCLQRQYKQCARRALEILQAAKEPVSMKPMFLRLQTKTAWFYRSTQSTKRTSTSTPPRHTSSWAEQRMCIQATRSHFSVRRWIISLLAVLHCLHFFPFPTALRSRDQFRFPLMISLRPPTSLARNSSRLSAGPS